MSIIRHNTALLCLAVITLCIHKGLAEVDVPNMFSDNMVLQRGMPIPVWGWATPGKRIRVTFAGQQKHSVAAQGGRWMVKLDPLQATATPQTMTIEGSNRLDFRNVLVGDVWLCSGDFGIFFELFKCMNADAEVANANFPDLRLLHVTCKSSNKPLSDIQGEWVQCLPDNVSAFSGLAYYFGRKLQQELKVPVGIIAASYRYSACRSWLTPESIRSDPELKSLQDTLNSWNSTTVRGRQAHLDAVAKVEEWLALAEKAFRDGNKIPKQPVLPAPKPAVDNNYLSLGELCNLYYGMIHPLAPFALRGVVWSQGENGAKLPKALITGWRKKWRQKTLPFYFELLPKTGVASSKPDSGTAWAVMRECQMKALALPDVEMAVSLDVSDFGLDPRNRKDPAERLAACVLAKEFGRDIAYRGPRYKSHYIENSRVIVSFKHSGSGLMVGKKNGLDPVEEDDSGIMKEFAIAGADKKWHWADARIEGDTVVLSSEAVDAPVAVRYAYRAFPKDCNLYNREGLPCAPFRTDTW